MNVSIEYGEGMMDISLPDSADIFVPGETIPDPPAIPATAIIARTRESLDNPLNMKPIQQLVSSESQVVIVFPDKVKGGFQDNSHRKTTIPLILEQLSAVGIPDANILLICSNGLHRKNTREEIRSIIGEEVFGRFWHCGRIVNHDSEDWDNLVDLGSDENGSRVIMNRKVYEADLAILIGHTLGNPYGGYSGGYKHSATGITHWRSIAEHHVPDVMHREDFIPVSHTSLMRRKFDSISQHMESNMKRPFFICDAVLDSRARQIAVFSGYGVDVQRESFTVANKRTYVPWATKKFNVMIFGMPKAFHYGNGHGTNPILMLQAISANVVRHRRILADNCVVICASICNGYFHDEEFPSYRALYELFQTDYHQTLPDLARFGEQFSLRQEWIDAYRYGYGYHPFHAFSMISCGHIAETHCAAIYIVGAQEPGYARGMGMKTRATVDEALTDAAKIVGPDPNILVLPKTFKVAGVHLMMKE
ncbi:MAG: DUF2088 domain-containing protein [Spirochaetaceae bacterium]|nr:MAG: DUF2088 domain-containing protein [Spirochaetaceae bacterium]